MSVLKYSQQLNTMAHYYSAAFPAIFNLMRASAAIRLSRSAVRSRQSRWLVVDSNSQNLERSQLYGQHSVHKVQPTSFSTEATSPRPPFFSSPLEWWRNRQESHEVEKYKARMVSLAQKEVWVVGDMVAELDEVVTSWKAKMPGVSSLRETQMAKKMHQIFSGIVKVAGKDATDETLFKMTRKDKLVAALEGDATVEEINTAIEQFSVMALVQRVVRKRKLEGKSIPATPEGVQALVQAQASTMMSKSRRIKMGKEQALKMMRRKR